MARIEGVSDREAKLMTRVVFRGAKGRVGKVTEPLRIMAKSPPIMWAAGLFELGLARGKSVDSRLKALASLKAASMIGCVF